MDPAIIVFIVFSSMTTVAIVIGLLVFFAKRLEHKQILAAIEKGTPLSDLKPRKSESVGPVWIKYLTGCGVGIAWLVRGLLCRKYEIQSRLSANDNTAEYKNPVGASAPEVSQQ
jgi:hypothetical protein